MSFHSFVIFYIFSYFLVQAICAPQGDVEDKALSLVSEDSREQSNMATDFIRAEILDELKHNCMPSASRQESLNELSDKNLPIQSAKRSLKVEENKYLDLTPEETIMEADSSVVNSMDDQRLLTSGGSDNDKEEEAFRNERDLQQALDAEQQLLELDDSPTDELCKEDCLTCNPNEFKLRCHNESTIALCTSTGTERLIRCSGLTPRCHPKLNVCSSKYLIRSDVSSADNQKPTFTCQSYNAYYPDVKSCRKFYYCANGKPYQYRCESNEVYNPLTRACALQSTTVPCRKFNCAGKNGRYTTYPGDPSVYALCSNNKAIEMFHCPLGQAMQEVNQQCQAHCLREGLMRDFRSCDHYYECTRRLPGFINSYKITRRSCPPNSVFNPIAAHCVPQDEYPQCATLSSTGGQIPVTVESSTFPTSYITSTPDSITSTMSMLPLETTLQY